MNANRVENLTGRKTVSESISTNFTEISRSDSKGSNVVDQMVWNRFKCSMSNLTILQSHLATSPPPESPLHVSGTCPLPCLASATWPRAQIWSPVSFHTSLQQQHIWRRKALDQFPPLPAWVGMGDVEGGLVDDLRVVPLSAHNLPHLHQIVNNI